MKDDVDLPFSIEQLQTPARDPDRLMMFLAEQGFKSLIASLGGSLSVSQSRPFSTQDSGQGAVGPFSELLPPVVKRIDYQLVTTPAQLDRWLDDARQQGVVAIDTETTDLNAAKLMLTQMSGGMRIALFTTLAGLSSGLILGVQYQLLDRAADKLFGLIVAAVDTQEFQGSDTTPDANP